MPGFCGPESGAESSTTIRASAAEVTARTGTRVRVARRSFIGLSFVDRQEAIVQRKRKQRRGGGKSRAEVSAPASIPGLRPGKRFDILRVPALEHAGRGAEIGLGGVVLIILVVSPLVGGIGIEIL